MHKEIALRENSQYKSTYRKMKELEGLNLVKNTSDLAKIGKKELVRAEKYYELSEEGIFALFFHSSILTRPNIFYYDKKSTEPQISDNLNVTNIIKECGLKLFENYENCNLFKMFLPIHFSQVNASCIDNNYIHKVGIYLGICCNIIKDFISSFPKGLFDCDSDMNYEYNKKNCEETILYDLSNLKNGRNKISERDHLLSFVKKIFSLGENNVRVKRIYDNKIIIDFSDENKVLEKIYLIYDGDKLVLEIYSIGYQTISKISLDSSSIKEIKIPTRPSYYFLNKFDFDLLSDIWKILPESRQAGMN